MIRGSRLLAVSALAVSGTLHLTGVSLFWREAPVEIEGGAPATVARLGNSFQDVAAGSQTAEQPEEVQDAEPPETRTEQVRPEELARAGPTPEVPRSEPDRAEPADTPAATRESSPSETMTPARPEAAATVEAIETAPVPPPETPTQTTEARVLPTPPLRPDPAASISVPVEPTETETNPEVAEPVAPSRPDEPDRPELAPEEPTVLAALPQDDDDVAPLISTRPNLRPREIEEAAREAAPPEPRPQPQRAAPAPGSNQPQQVRGSTDGERTASQTETSDRQSAAAARAGNAAASNYPGQVMRVISRQRRPSVNNRGTATISFQIASNGALSGLGVARSSGSQALDAAAVELVRRAAPFPPPPAGARRSFSIGIQGR